MRHEQDDKLLSDSELELLTCLAFFFAFIVLFNDETARFFVFFSSDVSSSFSFPSPLVCSSSFHLAQFFSSDGLDELTVYVDEGRRNVDVNSGNRPCFCGKWSPYL